MSVKINIKSILTDEQSKLVEKLALAIELRDSFKISVVVTRLEASGLRIKAGSGVEPETQQEVN